MTITLEEAKTIQTGLNHMSDKKRSFIERSMLDILGEPNHMEEGDIAIKKSLTASQETIYIALLSIATEARLEHERMKELKS